MVVSKLLLEEALDNVEVLDCFPVIVVIDVRVLNVLHRQVFLHNKLLPDLHNF